MHKTEELSNLKFSYFHMPEGSSPVCENENSTIREIFKNDVNFLPAAQFLEMMNFIVNPIDALYSVHKFLLSINKGALMHRLSGTEASFNDLQELLSFDDLFILMLGVLLSADIPEFASITNFIRVYSPTFCLSNSFDYAQAGIESLLVHIESLDIEGFVNKSMAKPE
ncbi:hypothetical protein TRFO_40866 [Tritrichomonas foetus]|uniref:VPS9 domain-containing protein n=1 Tax=Tritrichomonas foetus TaxID=1144522 RepID=A0A1J4J3T7_9EUKA|nr:hypothetical protein TRFO_40866 [Tritrichomonas foetus]|eukprot:OHS92823.1 hypothetical protein TRFO_40866 [Tritrichomonas foetus]